MDAVEAAVAVLRIQVISEDIIIAVGFECASHQSAEVVLIHVKVAARIVGESHQDIQLLGVRIAGQQSSSIDRIDHDAGTGRPVDHLARLVIFRPAVSPVLRQAAGKQGDHALAGHAGQLFDQRIQREEHGLAEVGEPENNAVRTGARIGAEFVVDALFNPNDGFPLFHRA